MSNRLIIVDHPKAKNAQVNIWFKHGSPVLSNLVIFSKSTGFRLTEFPISLDLIEEKWPIILDEAYERFDQIEEEISEESILDRIADHQFDMNRAENF